MAYKNKADQAACAARHYERNKDKMKARAVKYTSGHKKKLKACILKAKENQPCTDCGGIFHPHAMEFDHIGDDKLTAVAHIVTLCWSVEKLEAEIAKCELVCANCHRVRTWTRREGNTI